MKHNGGTYLKVAISSSGKDLTSDLDIRFGRCANFLIIDTESGELEIIDNGAIAAGGGAGIAAAQQLIDHNVEALITGNIGPNAFHTLDAAGIKIFRGTTGKASDLLDHLAGGKLEQANSSNVGGHFGLRRA